MSASFGIAPVHNITVSVLRQVTWSCGSTRTAVCSPFTSCAPVNCARARPSCATFTSRYVRTCPLTRVWLPCQGDARWRDDLSWAVLILRYWIPHTSHRLQGTTRVRYFKWNPCSHVYWACKRELQGACPFIHTDGFFFWLRLLRENYISNCQL